MDPMSMTIEQIASSHYLPEKRVTRRANTVEGYESSINLHVLPRWGTLTITEIRRDDIQSWVREFEKPGAAKKAFTCLRQILRWAIRKWSLLVADPTLGIELPRMRKYRFETLNSREYVERLRAFWGHPLEPVVILEMGLGLRPGEAYALQWRDIDMRSGEVVVNKTLQQTKGRELHVYPTKTPSGDRLLYLVGDMLKRLRDIWRSLGRPQGRIIGDLSPAAVAGRLRRFARKARIKDIAIRNLRHTWATLAADAGVPIEVIGPLLGHSSIEVAYQRYMRLTKRLAVDAQKALLGHVLKFSQ